jgi:type IV secretion system protein VirD4
MAGPVYPPHRMFVWYSVNGSRPAAAPIFRTGWLITAAVASAAALTTTSFWRRRQRVTASDSHGSAYWGSGEALHRDTGRLLGRQGPRLLRHAGEGHILTVAPTRSGKGVSCVIPNLLDHSGAVLVTDPKGENYAVTARWRREIGQEVFAFDPFGIATGEYGSATYNPLDLIDPASPEAVDDARMLADMVVLPEGREGEQAFWNEEARGVLTGLILHVAANAPRENRTLSHVRTLLTLAPAQFAELLAEMQASVAADGLVSRAAARILQKAEKERSGVISTAQSHTHFLDSPRMARVLGTSSADLSVLKRQAASVYLILPTDRLDAYVRWLRVMIACSLLAAARERGQPKERVLFLLDEFANLGRMGPVQRDISLAGAYGTSFWILLQDLSQLKGTYPDRWETFLANADVLQAFGINDWETAEYLSKMTGEATILVESENVSAGVSHGRSAARQQSAAQTTSEKGRRLLMPDEVRRLGRDRELLFVRGSAPVLATKLDYLRDPEYLGLADPNPMHDEPVAVPAAAAMRAGRATTVRR